ncbi:MAG TPA: DUF721 domain-containing protein [Actinomycetota bacterium]|nr:DUF721 domain-containing protein [Actinomycetota bacterium]
MARSSRGEERGDREPRPIGDVLRGMRTAGPLGPGLALGHLVRRWEELAGEELAGHTAPAALSGGTLIVRADSSGWAARTRFVAGELQRAAERVVGRGVVRSVRVVVGDA